jgi:hypothetical protein
MQMEGISQIQSQDVHPVFQVLLWPRFVQLHLRSQLLNIAVCQYDILSQEIGKRISGHTSGNGKVQGEDEK